MNSKGSHTKEQNMYEEQTEYKNHENSIRKKNKTCNTNI